MPDKEPVTLFEKLHAVEFGQQPKKGRKKDHMDELIRTAITSQAADQEKTPPPRPLRYLEH